MAGAISNDRKKAAHARRLILDEVIRLFERDPVSLSEGEAALKKDLLLRMAPNTLPRLTEVTGEEGGPLIIQLAKETADKYGITPSPEGDSQRQP